MQRWLMDTLVINAALESAQAILNEASVEHHRNGGLKNEPAWLKVYHAKKYLQAQQAALLADALADPQEIR